MESDLRILFFVLGGIVSFFLLSFIFLLLALRFSRYQGCLVFMHWLNFPAVCCLPLSSDICAPRGKRNIELITDDGEELGAWLFTKAASADAGCTTYATAGSTNGGDTGAASKSKSLTAQTHSAINPGYGAKTRRVVLYLHGNAFCRRHWRRHKAYDAIMQNLDADLLCVDYRGNVKLSSNLAHFLTLWCRRLFLLLLLLRQRFYSFCSVFFFFDIQVLVIRLAHLPKQGWWRMLGLRIDLSSASFSRVKYLFGVIRWARASRWL